MRLLKRSSDGLVFQVSRRERELLSAILRLYPCIPPGHHQLSRTTETQPSNQALLDEAIAEQRANNHRRVQKLMSDHAKWVQNEHGWKLLLAETDTEWLLQVLNDIRVGSWVLLGSPEENLHRLSEETAPHLWAMEISGGLQSALLSAIDPPQ